LSSDAVYMLAYDRSTRRTTCPSTCKCDLHHAGPKRLPPTEAASPPKTFEAVRRGWVNWYGKRHRTTVDANGRTLQVADAEDCWQTLNEASLIELEAIVRRMPELIRIGKRSWVWKLLSCRVPRRVGRLQRGAKQEALHRSRIAVEDI
jgi:hypothetical protein